MKKKDNNKQKTPAQNVRSLIFPLHLSLFAANSDMLH